MVAAEFILGVKLSAIASRLEAAGVSPDVANEAVLEAFRIGCDTTEQAVHAGMLAMEAAAAAEKEKAR